MFHGAASRCHLWFRANRGLLFLMAGWLVFFIGVRTLQHYSFDTNAWDLSVFDYAMSSTVKGDIMAEPFNEYGWGSHLAIHSTPILVILAPLYLLFQGPLFLLYLQVLAVGLSAIPLFLVARHRLGDKRMALAIAASFLIYRPLLTGLMRDFHPEMFFPLFIFSSYYFVAVKKNTTAFFICIFSALLLKEDFALYTLFYSLWLAWKTEGARKIGLQAALLCAVYFVLTLTVVIPYFRQQSHITQAYGFFSTWQEFGNTPGEIVRHVLRQPWRVLKELVPLSHFLHLANFFLPLLLVPMLSSAALLILPPLVVAWLSRIPSMASFGLHYGVALIPFIFLALVLGLDGQKKRGEGKTIRGKSLWRWLVVLMLVVNGANFKWNLFFPAKYRLIRDYPAFSRCLERLPAQAAVSAQSALIPHIPRRRAIAMLPRVGEAEYVMLHMGVNPWPLDKNSLQALLSELVDRRGYVAVCQTGDLWLLRKNRPN